MNWREILKETLLGLLALSLFVPAIIMIYALIEYGLPN
jgi:hypothetical protein